MTSHDLERLNSYLNTLGSVPIRRNPIHRNPNPKP